MHLPHFAQTFVDAGLIALIIDYRYLGESQGEPRFQVDPREQAQDYSNAITVRSIEYMATFDAGAFLNLIAPTPLLMILAGNDEFIPVPFNSAHFDRAGEPKRLFTYNGGHTASYDDPARREMTAGVARDWFVQYLLRDGRENQ